MHDSLSERDFARMAGLIEGHCGIRMPPSKRVMVEGRLRKRLRALGLRDLTEYCRWVLDGDGFAEEFPCLIDAVTTNKTDFFREPDHFRLLRDMAVPTLLKAAGPDPLVKVWSAACSCGAEAYTIAMVLADMSLGESRFGFSILGTDICTDVLEQAATAIYPADMVSPVPADMRRRYLLRSRDPDRQEVRIVPELRRTARFMQMNLMAPTYPVDRDMDVIFCRNILIYFDRPTQQAVLDRLCRHLRPGGYLFLGHSESMAGADLLLEQIAPTVFRME